METDCVRYPDSLENKLGQPALSDLCRTQGIFFLARHLTIDRLSSRQIYQILIHKTAEPPTSQRKIQEILNKEINNWSDIYLYGRKITIDSYTRCFNFKCTHNILFLNDRLVKMNLAASSSCSLCGSQKETMVHLFCKCSITIKLWKKLAEKLNIELTALTPESAFFGFYNSKNVFVGHIHLVFKIEIYKNRISGTTSVGQLINKT